MQHTLADGWGIANRVAVAVVGVVVGGEGEGGVQVSFCAKKERGGVVCFGGGSKKIIKPTQTTGTATLDRFEIASTEGHWINGLEVTYVHHHEP